MSISPSHVIEAVDRMLTQAGFDTGENGDDYQLLLEQLAQCKLTPKTPQPTNHPRQYADITQALILRLVSSEEDDDAFRKLLTALEASDLEPKPTPGGDKSYLVRNSDNEFTLIGNEVWIRLSEPGGGEHHAGIKITNSEEGIVVDVWEEIVDETADYQPDEPEATTWCMWGDMSYPNEA